MVFNFQGSNVDFKDIFFLYLQGVEGYKLKVYRDIYGNPTVGLGHEVLPSDNLSVGDVITDAQLRQLFDEDYNRLNIETYIQEAAQNYNQALAIGHFVWGHGDGEYKDSDLRQHMINRDLDYNGLISYLNSNWDVNKPSNQKVNKSDFTIYYSANPWIPSKTLLYYYNAISNFISDSAVTNPIATYGVSAAIIIGLGSAWYGIYRMIKNRKK